MAARLTDAVPWYWRWLVTGDEDRLHYVSASLNNTEKEPRRLGTAACRPNHPTVFWIPGVLSRLYLERCGNCCRVRRVKRGKGNPYNEATRTRALGSTRKGGK